MIAREAFPTVWARFAFSVRVVQRPSEIENVRCVCAACGRGGYGARLDGFAHDPPGWFRHGEALACSVACVTHASTAAKR